MKTIETHSDHTDHSALLAEAAARFRIPRNRLAVAVQAAECLTPEEFGLLEELVHLGSSGVGEDRRRAVAKGLRRVLEEQCQSPSDDPLADVDDPIEASEASAAVLRADLESRAHRGRLLRDCVSSKEAGRLTGRSRQAIEKQRREGRILALRLGRQWRYPLWQLDAEEPGGVIAGLPEILRLLYLSPAGAALWLTTSKPELGSATPLQHLRNRGVTAVIRLAEHHGHLP